MNSHNSDLTVLTDMGKGAPLIAVESGNRRLCIIDWVKNNKDKIDDILLSRGGVLFRNFRINGAVHFERFIREAFGYDLLSYENRSTPRSSVKGNVYSSTEYPKDQHIPLHNENSYTLSWARKIFFYCIKPAECGGETPVADSREIYKRLPEVVRKEFVEKGLMYVRNYHDLDLSWQEVFQTQDRKMVEDYCESNAMEYEWLSENHLRTKQVAQAVIEHPVTSEPIWFNQAHLFHISNLSGDIRSTLEDNLGKNMLPRNVYHADGSDINEEYLDIIRQAYEDCQFSFPWKSGDILLLDNMRVAHGRKPFEGSRKVVVGMIDPFVNNNLRKCA